VLKESVDPDIEDTYKDAKDLPIHYDPETDPEVQEFEREVFPPTPTTASTKQSSQDLASAALGADLDLEDLTPVGKVATQYIDFSQGNFVSVPRGTFNRCHLDARRRSRQFLNLQAIPDTCQLI
jgi:hypothetical protein